jgi:protein TonB
MTNKEILKADLLDIIFENRNKDYGAYVLRRDYNHRLLIALGAASSVILLFILINVLGKKDESFVPVANDNHGIVIRTIELPIEPVKPKELTRIKPVEKPAQIKYVSDIKIKPDNQVKTTLPVSKSWMEKQFQLKPWLVK